MEKNRKLIRVVWLCCVFVMGLVVGIRRPAFLLTDPVFYILLVLVIVSGIVIDQLWFREFMRSVNALLPILTKEKEPDRYIAELKKLLADKKSALLRAVLHINLSAGYCAKGDYKEAQRQLEAVDSKKITGTYRAIYLMNCAYAAFYLQENDKALAFMEQNKKGLARLKDTQELGGLVAVLRIFALLDRPEEARRLYETESARWQNEQTQDDFDHLKRLLWQETRDDATQPAPEIG